MKPIDYLCKKGGATVRVVAYWPQNGEGFKAVIQAVDSKGPIAEDPLYVEYCEVLDLARELHLMRNEGWAIEPSKAMLA